MRSHSDAGGTIRDTVLTVPPRDDAAMVATTMDARPHIFVAHIVNLVINGMVIRSVTQDKVKLKMWCECR